MAVKVGVGVLVLVGVRVCNGVAVGVRVGVIVGVLVGECVGDEVAVSVLMGPAETVTVGLPLGLLVGDGWRVPSIGGGTRVGVGVKVGTMPLVGEGVGEAGTVVGIRAAGEP